MSLQTLKTNATVPNAITLARLPISLIIPALFFSKWGFYGIGYAWIAVGCVCLAGLSDFVDGYFARLFPSQKSTLGSHLDPFMDALLCIACTLSLFLYSGLNLYSAITYGIPAAYFAYYSCAVAILRSRQKINGSNENAKAAATALMIAFGLIFGGAAMEETVWEVPLKALGVFSGWHAMFLGHLAYEEYTKSLVRTRDRLFPGGNVTNTAEV